jgi:N-acetylmuramoyl-L-alanine amidase
MMWYLFLLFPWFLLYSNSPSETVRAKAEIQHLVSKCLKKDVILDQFLKIHSAKCEITSQQGVVEHTFNFGKVGSRERRPGPFRVAIDPGHFGGKYARLEQKWLIVDNVPLQEGDLTLRTALLLKERLEKAGIEVLLTRTEEGKGAIKEEFEGGDFKVFNTKDLRVRAELVNAYNPDLTLMIHYNVHSGEGNIYRSTPKNYCLAFVPGAFCNGELDTAEDREHFYRLIATDDLKRSIELSQILISHLGDKLDIPIKSHEHYMNRVCKRVGKGIYARNLAMTRLVKGTLSYVEVLCQDCTAEVAGLKDGTRLVEVADSLFEGIIKWKRAQL